MHIYHVNFHSCTIHFEVEPIIYAFFDANQRHSECALILFLNDNMGKNSWKFFLKRPLLEFSLKWEV